MAPQPTTADLDAIDKLATDLETEAASLAALAAGSEAGGTADARATATGKQAMTQYRADVAKALGSTVPLFYAQAKVLRDWTAGTRAIQSKAAKDIKKNGDALGEIELPKDKPQGPTKIAGGNVRADGTVEL